MKYNCFSALHLVDMDEVFHFYAGSPMEMFQINQKGEGSKITMGSDIFNSSPRRGYSKLHKRTPLVISTT